VKNIPIAVICVVATLAGLVSCNRHIAEKHTLSHVNMKWAGGPPERLSNPYVEFLFGDGCRQYISLPDDVFEVSSQGLVKVEGEAAVDLGCATLPERFEVRARFTYQDGYVDRSAPVSSLKLIDGPRGPEVYLVLTRSEDMRNGGSQVTATRTVWDYSDGSSRYGSPTRWR